MRRGRPMLSRLRWITAVLVVVTGSGVEQGGLSWAKDTNSDTGIALQTVLELEHTARLLAVLLDSGRSVINENQVLFDDPAKAEKGFTPEVFERQLARMFLDRSGLDLAELDAANIPSSAKKWLKDLLSVSKQVVKDAQPEIN